MCSCAIQATLEPLVDTTVPWISHSPFSLPFLSPTIHYSYTLTLPTSYSTLTNCFTKSCTIDWLPSTAASRIATATGSEVDKLCCRKEHTKETQRQIVGLNKECTQQEVVRGGKERGVGTDGGSWHRNKQRCMPVKRTPGADLLRTWVINSMSWLYFTTWWSSLLRRSLFSVSNLNFSSSSCRVEETGSL